MNTTGAFHRSPIHHVEQGKNARVTVKNTKWPAATLALESTCCNDAHFYLTSATAFATTSPRTDPVTVKVTYGRPWLCSVLLDSRVGASRVEISRDIIPCSMRCIAVSFPTPSTVNSFNRAKQHRTKLSSALSLERGCLGIEAY